MKNFFAIKKNNNSLFLSDEDIHHLKNVLRFKNGDNLHVNYENKKYLSKISNFSNNELEIINQIDKDNDLKTEVTLILSLIKKENFELIIQKASELGVKSIIPYQSIHSVVKIDSNNKNEKILRWQKIADRACKQSRRNSLLKIHEFLDINNLSNYKSDLNLVAYEKKEFESRNLFELLNKKNKSITIFIGPEGGFSNEEINIINKYNFDFVSLGKRILKSETASIYLLSLISFFGEINE